MQEVFLFPLVAALLFSAGSIFDKFISENKMPHSTAYFFLQSLFAITFFPVLATLIFGFEVPSMALMPLILFAAITANIGFFLYFYIVREYDISSVGPLAQTKLLFAIPLAYLFLNEFYGFEALALMLLIFPGAILTTYSKKFSLKSLLLNNRLLIIALAMAFFWALSDLPVKAIVSEIQPATFMIWRYLLSIPVIAVFALFLFKGDAKKTFVQSFKSAAPFGIIATIIGFTGMMFLFTAYKFSYTIPSALVLSQGIFVFAIAFILSRVKSSLIDEKHELRVYAVRLAGVALIVSSIFLLMNGSLVI